MKMYEDVKMDPTAEAAVVQSLANLFNDVAYMVPEDVRHNIQAACDGGFSKEDRTLNSGVVNYLLNRFSLIFVGILSNVEFRQSFVDAIAMEQNLEDQTPEMQEQIRADMNSIHMKNSKNTGHIMLDFSVYDDELYKKISARMLDSFSKLDGYDSSIDEIIDHQTDESKESFGFIVSNFAYLLRAFNRNMIFFAYVSSVLKSVQEELGLEY